jgi:hypothetical protein
MACLLAHAASGFPYSNRDLIGLPPASILARKAQPIRAGVTKIMARGPLVLESDTRFSLQNALYEEIHAKLHVNTLVPLFLRRLRTVFAPLAIPLQSISWDDAFAVLNKVGVHLAMVVVKT